MGTPKTIADLDALAGTDVAAADLVPVWDDTASVTKKVTPDELLAALVRLAEASGGTVTLTFTATGSGAGNTVIIGGSAAGSGNSAGGSVVVVPGLKAGSGADGEFVIRKPGGVAGTDEIALFNGPGGFGTTAQILNRQTGGGFLYVGSTNGVNFGNITGNFAASVSNTGGVPLVSMVSTGRLGWTSSSSDPSILTAQDTAITRAATKVVKITDGSTGSGTLSSIPISPAQLTGNVNDYAPTAGGRLYRLSADAARTITGLVAGVDGQECWFVNVGSFPITLSNASGSSSAANQFTCAGGSDIVFGPGEKVHLIYSATTTKWLTNKERSDTGEGEVVVRTPGGVAGQDQTEISGSVISIRQGGGSTNRSFIVAAGAAYFSDLVLKQPGTDVASSVVIGWAATNVARVANSSGTAPGWLQNTAAVSRVNTASPVTNATDTMANITGLSSTLIAGRKYRGTLTLFVSTDIAAEGAKFDFAGGAATATAFNAAVTSNVQGATLTTTVSAALATDLVATALSGTGVNCLIVTFDIVVDAGGTFIPRFSQVAHAAGTLTVVAADMVLEDIP